MSLLRFAIIAFLLLLSAACISQNAMLDSLMKKDRELQAKQDYNSDTTRLNVLYFLSRELISTGAYAKADSVAAYSYGLAEKKEGEDKKHGNHFFSASMAKSVSNRGIVASCQGNPNKALEHFNRSLDIFTNTGDRGNASKIQGNIANVLKDQGSYARALEFYFKALKVSEELGNKRAMAIHLANIGNVYKAQMDYPKSLVYYFKGLALAEEMQDTRGIAADLSNIGIVYKNQGELEKALEYYFKALKMAESLDYKLLIANTLGNIGSVYTVQKKYPEALDYLRRALQIVEELGDKAGLARITGNLATIYTNLHKYTEAEQFLKKALALATEAGDLNLIKEQHNGLSQVYEAQGRWSESLKEYKLYTAAKDSIFNEENTKKALRSELNFEFEKKATADSVKNASAQKIKDATIKAKEAELKQERTQRYSLYGGLLLVLVFSGFLFNRFQITSRQKRVIEQQKVLVEEKNKEVIDSINYARRIQDALLKEGEGSGMPEHFILFKPKDIVSGDFYWSAEKQGYWYFCVADCTGHGVPGAFMSMLGIAYLNEITSVTGILSPSEILGLLRDKIVKELKQKGESGESKDGMDISLIRYHAATGELQWAGANNALWIRKNGQAGLLEIKPDKQPIGYTISPVPFRTHTLQVEKGDILYLFTDGYADQFGGPKGKKFKYKQLQETIIGVYDRPLPQQKEFLHQTFESWKGQLEQLDDVAFAGIRI
ncbi:MAG: hypothetical protein JWO09_1416 [Bacteroidetes bacterium]|nr:hypothetical protein [Bacteroidota bacterium]